jgi:hypothetical protein
MPKKKISKSAIKASAKAEVVARATYQRKRTTTEVIPPDVTRAKTVAWLDLISPLTEWAGLKGDELKLRRSQLRLQREDVLAEIVERARRRLENSQTDRKPIQNKFLVPFLEQASLEDENSSLIDMWAGLLASAAEGGSSNHIHFVSIMSQLSGRQGELFAKLVHTVSERVLALAMDKIKELESHSVRETIASALMEIPATSLSDFEPAASRIADLMNCVGVEVVYGDVSIGPRDNYVQINFVNDDIFSDEIEIDFSILEAVGLIRRVDARIDGAQGYSVTLVYYHLTAMGYYFASACALVSDLGNVLHVEFDDDKLVVTLDKSRKIAMPLDRFPNLLKASALDREDYRITRISVEWEKLGEEIMIEKILQQSRGVARGADELA